MALTGSTNVDLANRIAAGEHIAEGYWLRAEQQDGGRGRLGRKWVSPTGNLYCSTVVDVRAGDPAPHTLSFVAALAVYDTLKRSLLPNADIALKWPNDALVSGAKIAGILLERSADSIVAGIGINVCHAPEIAGREVTSILYENGKHGGSCDLVLSILADAFAQRLTEWRSKGLPHIFAEWESRAHAHGEMLSVTGPDAEKVTGTYAGLGEDGSLQLRLPGGTLTAIYAGDVTRL